MSNKNFQPLFIEKRWSHHTSSGGYDRLCRNIPSKSVFVHKKLDSAFYSFRNVLRGKLLPSTRYTNTYRMQDLIAEMRVFYSASKKETSLVHAIYAEDQLNFLLSYRNKLNAALVGTFHLPAESEFFKKVIRAGYMKRYNNLDAAIVVSKSMIRDFEAFVGKGNVFFVPHGIDTAIFTPGNITSKRSIGKSLSVLTVGIHGRDWDVVRKVSSYFKAHSKSVDFHAVVPEKNRELFKKNPEIHLHSEISEKALIDLYRSVDVLFIPLQFATANNSLLEAMACGTPVISTNIGGIPDYLDQNCGWLLQKGDIRSAIELFEELSETPEELYLKREAARRKALQFEWKEVAKHVEDVHQFAIDRWKIEK